MSDSHSISIASKIKEVGRHSIIYGLGSVAQSAAGLILLPLLTHSLSKEDFGVYSLIQVVSGIASAIFYFGMASALPRSYFDYESSDDRRAVFTTAFVILFAGALLQIVLGYLFAAEISAALVNSPDYADAVALALLGGALGFINTYFFGYLRLLRKSIPSVLFSVVSLVSTIGLTFYFLSKSPGNLNAPLEAAAYTQLAIALVFAGVYGKSAFILRLKSAEIPNLAHFGFASIIASFGGVLIDSLDRFLIEHYMTLADVGTYSAALRVGMLINVVLIMPFAQIWSPMMMEYRNKTNIAELFTHVFSAFMMLGGVVVIAAALFAQDILPLLIRSGVDSTVIAVFIISASGLLIYGATNFVGAGLFYERKAYMFSYAYYGIALLKLLAGVVMIPVMGLIGAALTAILSYAAVPVAIYAMAKKYFSFRIEWRRLGIFSIIVLPPLAYGFLSATHLQVGIVARFAWLSITLLLIYYKCFSFSEREVFKSILRRRSS